MLTLSLLRHAKSSWTDLSLDDHDRPLAKRGAKAMPYVAKFIEEKRLKPDLVLCSDAMRTRATLALLLAELGPPPPRIVYDDALYLAAPQTILSTLASTAGDERNIMIVGHNPGFHALALELVGDGERKTIAAMAREFPTAALAVFAFDVASWTEVAQSGGHLIYFTTPRRLGA